MPSGQQERGQRQERGQSDAQDRCLACTACPASVPASRELQSGCIPARPAACLRIRLVRSHDVRDVALLQGLRVQEGRWGVGCTAHGAVGAPLCSLICQASTHLYKLLGVRGLDVHRLLVALHGGRLVALRPECARPCLVLLAAALAAALLIGLWGCGWRRSVQQRLQASRHVTKGMGSSCNCQAYPPTCANQLHRAAPCWAIYHHRTPRRGECPLPAAAPRGPCSTARAGRWAPPPPAPVRSCTSRGAAGSRHPPPLIGRGRWVQAALGRCGRREQGPSTGCNNFSDQRMRAGCSDAGGGPARRQVAAPCSSNLDRRRQQRAPRQAAPPPRTCLSTVLGHMGAPGDGAQLRQQPGYAHGGSAAVGSGRRQEALVREPRRRAVWWTAGRPANAQARPAAPGGWGEGLRRRGPATERDRTGGAGRRCRGSGGGPVLDVKCLAAANGLGRKQAQVTASKCCGAMPPGLWLA